MKHRIVTFFLLFLLASPVTFSGGFQLNEHGSKPLGLGGAFTAIADDASAVYWNGAGLSFLEGTNLILGSALIAPGTSFRGVTPSVDKTFMDSQVFYVPHFFLSHKLSESFSVGLGVSVPFGLGTRWPDGWVGRYLAVETEVQVLSAPLVVSWAILDNLSISAGGSYSHATVLIQRMSPQLQFAGDVDVKLEGDEPAAFGYNFGFMWKPLEILSIGGSYRSEVKYSFEGTAESIGAEQLSANFPAGDISAELTTPVNIQGGVALQVIKSLRLSADFQWVGWSSYDVLAVDFVDPNFTDISSPRDYEDTYIIRFGAEFCFNDDLSLLGGVYFDKNPVSPENANPSLPDSDRLGFSIGVDAKITDNFGISGSYLFIRSAELNVTNSRELYTSGTVPGTGSPFNGTYNAKANLLSLSAYYSFN
ncbi:OmpP1/FadL family transporter [Bacteroidota bacterium]